MNTDTLLKKCLTKFFLIEDNIGRYTWSTIENFLTDKIELPSFLCHCTTYLEVEGDEFHDVWDYNERVIRYLKASLLICSNFEAAFLLAKFYNDLGKYKKALKYLDPFLPKIIPVDYPHYSLSEVDDKKISEEDLEGLLLKQELLFNLRKYSDSLLVFEKINSLRPENSKAYFIRGKVFVQLRFYEKAFKNLLTAIKLDNANLSIPKYILKYMSLI